MTVRRDESRCSADEPWAVLDSTGKKLLGCHATEEQANEQLAAIEINKRGNKMNMLERLKADEERFIKKFDEFFLREMNDEELQGEMFFMLGQMRRLEENMAQLEGEAEERGIQLNKKKDESSVETEPVIDNPSTEPRRVLKGYSDSDNPVVAFVGASPSRLDMVRGRVFTGPVGKVLKDVYYPAIGVDKSEIYHTNIVPMYLTDENGAAREPNPVEIEQFMPQLKQELAETGVKFVVGLGKTASKALESEGILNEFVPHPRAIVIHGDSGEVGRKLSRLAKKTENSQEFDVAVEKNEKTLEASILKTEDEQQLVFGVVIEPEVEDTDGNWTTAEEIEKAAHQFMITSQTMGIEHVFKADDVSIVESYIAPVDFELGGNDVAKGSWILAAKVMDDSLWEMVKSGEITGFSFGGRAKIDPSQKLD